MFCVLDQPHGRKGNTVASRPSACACMCTRVRVRASLHGPGRSHGQGGSAGTKARRGPGHHGRPSSWVAVWEAGCGAWMCPEQDQPLTSQTPCSQPWSPHRCGFWDISGRELFARSTDSKRDRQSWDLTLGDSSCPTTKKQDHCPEDPGTSWTRPRGSSRPVPLQSRRLRPTCSFPIMLWLVSL